MSETLTEIPLEEKDLTWGGKYPAGINLGKLYANQIAEIDQALDEEIKTQLRTEVVNEIYEKYFRGLEQNKPIFFNTEIPKKKCIPGMLRQLLDKLREVLKFNKEVLEDLKNASGEAVVDFIEHDKLHQNFPLKMRIDRDQIRILIGNPNLTEEIEGEELEMPDPEALRGRGMAMMAAFSDYFEARRNPERDDYAFLIIKNLQKSE